MSTVKKKSKDTISQWFMEIKTLKRILLKVTNCLKGIYSYEFTPYSRFLVSQDGSLFPGFIQVLKIFNPVFINI